MNPPAHRPQAAIITGLLAFTLALLGLLVVPSTGSACGNFKPSTTWPSLRGAMTWSTNWDALNGSAFANQVGAHVHSLP